MNRSVRFNDFQEDLQGLVYKNSDDHSAQTKIANARPLQTSVDKPIPKPVPDFWRPNFISKYINYKPLKTK